MKFPSYLFAAFSAATLISCFKLPIPASPAAQDLIKSPQTRVPLPHRATLGVVNSKSLERPVKARQNNTPSPFRFCRESFQRPSKLCFWCGRDDRRPGKCDKMLISGEQGSSANCSFVTPVFPSSAQSTAGSGTQRFCQCGLTVASINLAVSGTSTTTYCALGSPIPSGFSHILATNGVSITTASPELTPTQKPTTAPKPRTTPKPKTYSSAKSSTTSSCNLAWCGAPFCFPSCGLA